METYKLTYWGLKLWLAKCVCVHACVCNSIPARALSLLVSQTWTPLLEPTASKPAAVGWKSRSSSLPSPGLKHISALTGCSRPGSHTRHTFTCRATEGERKKIRDMLLFNFNVILNTVIVVLNYFIVVTTLLTFSALAELYYINSNQWTKFKVS